MGLWNLRQQNGLRNCVCLWEGLFRALKSAKQEENAFFRTASAFNPHLQLTRLHSCKAIMLLEARAL